jgi:hypothetical protein
VPKLVRLDAGFPSRRPGVDPGSSSVGFVVDKVVLEQVSPVYFDFPCQLSFNRLLHPHLSSVAGTIGQSVADVPSGLSLTLHHERKNRNIGLHVQILAQTVLANGLRYFPQFARKSCESTFRKPQQLPRNLQTQLVQF